MDPLQVKPHEAAGWTAAIGALSAFLARLFKVRRAAGESPRVRELEAENEALKERVADQKLQLVLQPLNEQLANVLRENGRQQGELDVCKRDLNALGNKLRGLEEQLDDVRTGRIR